jgi:hypothetical protein
VQQWSTQVVGAVAESIENTLDERDARKAPLPPR